MNILKLRPPEHADPETDTYPDLVAQAVDLMRHVDPHYSEESVVDDSWGGNLHIAQEGDLVQAAAIFHSLDAARSEIGETEGWLSYIAVGPEYRGMGIGSSMIDYFSAMCLAGGAWSINAIPTSTRAREFFGQRNGFVQVDHPSFGKIMRKRLP